MKKRSFPGRRMVCGTLAFFFILCLGLDSEALARAGRGRSFKSRGSSSSKSYQQNPGSTPSTPQKNYQQQSQQPQPQPQFQPTSIPPPSTPPSRTKAGFFSGFAGGVTGAVLGGMLFRSLGITVPGWGAGFGMADIFLILLILGIIFYEVKSLRDRRATRSAATRAGRSPYSNPIRTAGGNRQVPHADKRWPTRSPGMK